MKSLKACVVENCVPTAASCVEWNGGDIEYLGICNGDPLNQIVWEIVGKLEDITGEDLSSFDLDSLLAICKDKAPLEVNLLSILTALKNSSICLNDFIETLNERINELTPSGAIKINLKCYADFDNLGNSLAITREEFDQLLINVACDHKLRIETIEGKIINLKKEIEAIDPHAVVDELSIATCLDAGPKPTSEQVIITTQELCDLEQDLGVPSDISTALTKTAQAEWNIEWGIILAGDGWKPSPANMAENYGNLLLAFNNLWERVKTMEDTCCAFTCSDITLGFSAIFNEDGDGIILKFTPGAGTYIPTGFTDGGSTGTITDKDGNVESFNIIISQGLEQEIPITGLNTTGNLTVHIDAIITNGTITCDKCLDKTVKNTACGYCEITASGAEGTSAVIIYDAGNGDTLITIPVAEEIEDTTSTTTEPPL